MNRTLFCASLFAAVLAVQGVAQDLHNGAIADVPFAFAAGKVTMPAGKYIVQTISPGVLRVSSEDRAFNAMLHSTVTQREEITLNPRLVFNRYGDRYFLSRVWGPGSRCGVAIAPTKLERELIAKTNEPADTSTVIARRR